jgi:acetolactate synthase regulatory subunit
VGAAVSENASSLKPEDDKRRLFLVIADDTPDALMRVLGVANVQQTRLRALTAQPDGAGLSIRLELDDQGDERAQILAARLSACPSVRGVGFGWR